MDELDAIFSILESEPEACREAVLATVVHVKGSAYRRPGARMLILPDGRRIGTISGGCLEGDVCKKAWWYTEGGRPSVRVFDTASGDDAVWEFGLGCKGQVHVLFERVSEAETLAAIRFAGAARVRREPVVVATVVAAEGLPSPLGARLLVDASGVRGGALAGSPVADAVLEACRESFLRQKSQFVRFRDGFSADVFVESFAAAQALVVFGAGHDAQPVVRLARELGWHITVADGRRNYATKERFPEADRVALMDPRDPLAGVEIGRDTAVVLMTHNYPQDVAILRRAIPAKPRYLGLLGPKSRSEELLAEVGLPVTGIDLHAPVGLDLGSDNPASIALAIVAEIQTAIHSREGGMLRKREAPIHEPAIVSGGAEDGVEDGVDYRTEAVVCEIGV